MEEFSASAFLKGWKKALGQQRKTNKQQACLGYANGWINMINKRCYHDIRNLESFLGVNNLSEPVRPKPQLDMEQYSDVKPWYSLEYKNGKLIYTMYNEDGTKKVVEANG